jgi:serine/threonine-protein kinase
MELLEGNDLDSLVKRFGPLPAERVAHILRQACASLADAHYHGVIHRDIKPANIYTCRLGPTVDFIKVLDFGLVRVFGQPSEEETQLTADGTATGTPAFMAPEMALSSSDVGPRADIYSLACVGYVLLTGKLVFEADTAMAMLLHHAKTLPTPPSERTETEIPAAIENVILQCLEKDPNDRPGSAEELARMLEDMDLGTTWSQGRARDWWDLHLPGTGLDGAGPTPIPGA